MNADYFRAYSTADLTELLDRFPGGSATHRAAQEELRRRQLGVEDTETGSLFTKDEIAETKRKEK